MTNSVYKSIFSVNTPPLLSEAGSFLTSEIIGVGLLVAEAYNKSPKNYVVVVNNLYNAQKMLSFLSSLVDPSSLLFYPSDDILYSEVLSETKELEAQRIYTMFQALRSEKTHIYVTNLGSLTRPTLDKNYFNKFISSLTVNDTLTIGEFINILLKLGYQRVSHVEMTNQFSTRGDIVDFYPVNEALPVRVEFFDDVIESIRTFNVGTQMSQQQITTVSIIPATEYVLENDDTLVFINNIKEEYAKQLKFSSSDEKASYYEELEKRIESFFAGKKQALSKFLFFLPLLNHSILEYIDHPHVVLSNEPQLVATNELLNAQADLFIKQESRKYLLLPEMKIYAPFANLYNYDLTKTTSFSEDNKEADFRFSPVEDLRTKDDFKLVVNKYIDRDYKIFFSVNNIAQTEQLKKLLEYAGQRFVSEEENVEASIIITNSYFPEGFSKEKEKIALFTSKELFNIARNENRFTSAFKSGSIIRSHDELKTGDFVVHEHHGIGQYLKIESRVAFGTTKDYISLLYAGDVKLEMPLEQIQLLRKYSGREGSAPKLNRLGTQEWTKTKARISEKINNIADSLLMLEAVRSKTNGYPFPQDDEFQREFEIGFPYELTPDQEYALNEIKADMELPHVMDRLLSGDVGFGKTEVALRAAFKAISAGKQVIFLCPTTLLARQHYEVAINRFTSFGVEIGMISRLVSQKTKVSTIEKFKNGEIHLLIGTHALFSVNFEDSNVGLLIVDEEQRFGVEQKEIIKNMKAKVDVLTLSATPIPRTLQMALVGVRGLSQINTPPLERMPIQTYVIKRDEYVIKDIIERELGRGGQVFYLYNKISTIYQVASNISKKVPEAKIGVIHGKMDKNDIEDIMNSFYNNELNVLVATSIIENGIDVPNANVVIIENADTFGLSQLYQIKGRVGRGNRIGYAYLLYQGQKIINDVAKKRLEAIQEFTSLGSGHKIAERDLMIRGAGDILGAEQSGFIDSVGIDMYLKMLQDTINNKKYNLESESIEQNIIINGIEAYIPEGFASNADKFNLYLDIKQCKTLPNLVAVENKVKDMFGYIPQPVQNLFTKRQIELMVNSRAKYVEAVSDDEMFLDILPGQSFLTTKGAVFALDEKLADKYDNIRFVTTGGKIKIRILKKGEWFKTYSSVVRAIVSIVREKNNVI